MISSFDANINKFEANKTNLYVDYKAQIQSIYVTNLGNATFNKVDSGFGVDWLSVTSSLNNVYLSFAYNGTGSPREMFLDITNEEATETIRVFINQSKITVAKLDFSDPDNSALNSIILTGKNLSDLTKEMSKYPQIMRNIKFDTQIDITRNDEINLAIKDTENILGNTLADNLDDWRAAYLYGLYLSQNGKEAEAIMIWQDLGRRASREENGASMLELVNNQLRDMAARTGQPEDVLIIPPMADQQ